MDTSSNNEVMHLRQPHTLSEHASAPLNKKSLARGFF